MATTIKQVKDEAASLSNLTGSLYELQPNDGGYVLNQTTDGVKHRACSGKLKEIYDWMYRFHIGVEAGLHIAARRLADSVLNKGPRMPEAASKKKAGVVPEGLRAFKGTFLVAIDEKESEEDVRVPITQTSLVDYLLDAAIIDVDTEEYGNPLGWQSLELMYSTLEELTPDQMALYYGKDK